MHNLVTMTQSLLFLILHIMSRRFLFSILLDTLIVMLLSACSLGDFGVSSPGLSVTIASETPSSRTSEIVEKDILEIPLPNKLGSASMEYSGLAWYRDALILLPQYPDRLAIDRNGFLYAIELQNLVDFVNNPKTEITVDEIPFDDADLSRQLVGFEGFEAIVFIDESIYLTIETRGGDPMKSFLVKGKVESDQGEIIGIKLDAPSLVELPVQNNNSNASYETLTTDGNFIYSFFEQNGEAQNDNPYAFRFGTDLKEKTEIEADSINYRLTDATMVDDMGCFWMINYFFPGDTHLVVDEDPISARYGLGESHRQNEPVERLVKYCLNQEGFHLTQNPPLYLKLLENDEARNWEGLAEFGDLGFLIITDKFPGSILAFIEFKQ